MQIARRRFLGLLPLAGLAACGVDLPGGVPKGVSVESIPGWFGAADIAGLRYETDRLQPAGPEAAGSAMHAFTAKFWNALPGVDENMAASPYSLATVLNIVGMGADGELLKQYEQVLGGDMDSVATQLSAVQYAVEGATAQGAESANYRKQKRQIPGWRAVNALFMHNRTTFSAEFLRRAYAGLGASGYQIDFKRDPGGARQAINAFVAKQTKDLIDHLVPPDVIDELTELMAVNTLWLKFAWDEEPTVLGEGIDFKTKAGPIKVPAIAMSEMGRYAEGPGWRSGSVSLIGRRMCVTFILPDKWPQELTAKMVAAACNAPNADLEVTAPKFKVSGALDLQQPMNKMGLTHAFKTRYPNFTGDKLVLSKVLQECVVSLDETGIEAVAATAEESDVPLAPAPPDEPKVIILDRPFWFIVHDVETNAPLFMGSVADPS